VVGGTTLPLSSRYSNRGAADEVFESHTRVSEGQRTTGVQLRREHQIPPDVLGVTSSTGRSLNGGSRRERHPRSSTEGAILPRIFYSAFAEGERDLEGTEAG